MTLRALLGRRELVAFISLSLVSLFADMAYEGARSVLGAYLEVLKATAIVAGVVSIGDLLGYLMRGVGGFIAGVRQSSRVYWGLVFIGYTINLLAVPLLAFAGRWEIALTLVLLERIGKGLRTPARDVILAEITEGIGRGKGFGIHEFMDQIGAVTGPLLVTWSLYSSGGNYSLAFLSLAIPALAALCFLAIAYMNYPSIKAVKKVEARIRVEGLSKSFWLFTIGTALLSLGYSHWALAAYHIKAQNLAPGHIIALLYTAAMLVDAAAALPAGILYDKLGPKTILVTPMLVAATTPLLLSNQPTNTMIGAILWGIVMGIYETNMRVVVADTTSPQARAYAYGIYGMVFGASWTIGNTILALLLETTPNMIPLYVVVTQVAALIALIAMLRSWSIEYVVHKV